MNASLQHLSFAALYIPYGFVMAAVLLEVFARFKSTRSLDLGILFLIAVATASAVLSLGVSIVVFAVSEANILGFWSIGWAGLLVVCGTLAFYLKYECHRRRLGALPDFSQGTSAVISGSWTIGYRTALAAAAATFFIGIYQMSGDDLLAKGSQKVADNAPLPPEGAQDNNAGGKRGPDPAEPETLGALIAKNDNKPTPEKNDSGLSTAQPDTPASTATEPGEEMKEDGDSGAPTVASSDPNAIASDPDPATAAGVTPTPDAPDPGQEVATTTPEAMTPADNSATTPPTPTPVATTTPDPVTPVPATTPVTTSTPTSTPKTAFKSTPFYATKVQPLLSKYCYDCHGMSKQKGGLRLDSPSWIRNGGKSGPVIVAGNPTKSALYTLVILPKDDPDIMPSKGATMKVSETKILEQWIRTGADLGDNKPFNPAGATGAAHVAATAFKVDEISQALPTPDAGAIEKLKEQFVLFRPASANGALLEVDFSHVKTSGGKYNLAADLAPLAQNIYTLDLSKAEITDSDLAILPSLVNLTKLHLNRTPITDAGLANLKTLARLESLNLYGTKVTDSGIAHLVPLTNLKKLYLFQTDVTPAGLIPLRTANPGLTINIGQ